MATAPKSNRAYLAIDEALDFVEKMPTGSVPMHLKDSHYKGAKALGHGKGYEYPHDNKRGFVKQSYLPEGYENEVFYQPSTHGREKTIGSLLSELEKIKQNES